MTLIGDKRKDDMETASNEHVPVFRVLLGITGCIAAYKSCEVLRALQKRGCDVKVVMTAEAEKFVGEPTFRALSGHPVGTSLFEDPTSSIPHIELAQNCDLFLIAPCTGNALSKIACGIADDLLTSCASACSSPILIAPAMNVHMYRNPATQDNIAKLKRRGLGIIDASYGRLACGDIGEGKLAPVDDIVEAAMGVLESGSSSYSAAMGETGLLRGKKVLITSGPTVEPIDPVRFISNRSSGKMGAALARAALDLRADVAVVSGPVSVDYPEGADIANVLSADEMLEEVMDRVSDSDIAIFAAAVSDFKPATISDMKIKKADGKAALSKIELVENPDIAALASKHKRQDQIFVGFAAETNDILSNGRLKLASKGADIIVCNEVGKDKAFGKDENSGWLITADSEEELPMMSKDAMARLVLEKAASLLGK